MLNQVLDNFRKASETSMQMQQDFRKASETSMHMQQEMLKKWMGQWPTMLPATDGTAWAEQAQTLQKRWLEGVTEVMNKHREKLDAQYKAGIAAIEDAFRLTEAKTPEDYRRMTEDLWKRSFETLKGSAETQIHDLRKAVEKWFELAEKAKVSEPSLAKLES
jgi:hypothetical protein